MIHDTFPLSSTSPIPLIHAPCNAMTAVAATPPVNEKRELAFPPLSTEVPIASLLAFPRMPVLDTLSGSNPS